MRNTETARTKTAPIAFCISRWQRPIRALLLAVVTATPLTSIAATSPPTLLAGVFQDHVVLQRDQPIALWGRAAPRESLTISLDGSEVQARAAADGTWRAELPGQPAGGPFQLTVRAGSGAVQRLHDVLVGDVWLCSGQSNMVLQVHRALDSRAEIEAASDTAIRMFTVPQETSLVPLDDFKVPAEWQLPTAETVPDFSAACYFFARELRKTVNVPMGLVNSSWGGSAISTWMDEAALQSVGGLDERLAILDAHRTHPERGNELWGALWERWWREASGDAPGAEPWNAPADGTWKPVPSFVAWEHWTGAGLESFNGMVWYRTTVTLTAEQAAQRATVRLGGMDDVDQTFVNGRPVGNTASWDTAREYSLPPGTLREGENSILVNVLDNYGPGGMTGPAEDLLLRFDDDSVVGLDGPWLYRVAPAEMGSPPRTPWEATAGLSTIANAMIAPLGRFGFRGVLWYQGESDTGQADRYAARLAALMQDWRARFGAELPFLIVQIAGYGPPSATPVDTGSARIREAERLAVEADGNAALAVTVDIGVSTDIHPANKQELARRLARAARYLVYGEAISPSGPRPLAARRDGEAVVVRFRDVEGALVAYSAARPVAFELCAADGTECRFVDATIDGDTVTLDAAGGPANRVRYCWGDSPVCNLYDGSGLPAGPFELEVSGVR